MGIHDAPVHSVTLSANSQIVATASWDGTVKLCNFFDNEPIRTLGGPAEGETHDTKIMNGLYAVAFSKTAPSLLGCTSCDKCVYLWNHVTGEQVSKLVGHGDEVNG